MRCLNCEGGGCDQCGMRGHFRITRCPHRIVTRQHWDVMRACKFAEKGLLPVAGGMLDQSQSFLDAMALVWSDDAWWKSKRRAVSDDD